VDDGVDGEYVFDGFSVGVEVAEQGESDDGCCGWNGGGG